MNIDLFKIVIFNQFFCKLIFDNVRNGCNKCRIERKQHYKWEHVSDSACCLACYGYLDQLREFNKNYPPAKQIVSTMLQKSLEYTTKQKFKSLLVRVINMNQFKVFKYYFEELKVRTDYFAEPLFYIAVKLNRVEFIDYILTLRGSIDMIRALSIAPLSNNIDLLKMIVMKMKKQSANYNPNEIGIALDNCAFVGRIDMFEWLLANVYRSRLPIKHRLYENATRGGHLHFIKYLEEHEVEYRVPDKGAQRPVNYAISYDKLDVLKYLVKDARNGSLGKSTLSFLLNHAFNSSIELIEWAFVNIDAKCTETLPKKAAHDGRLDIIKWLHENIPDCFTDGVMNRAADRKHFHIVKWLQDNRTEGCTEEAMNVADHLEIIRLLHENRTEGCTSNAMDLATSLEVIQWLHYNRTEGCSNVAMDLAAHRGDIDTLKWLHANRTEGCTWNALLNAVESSNFECIKWLHVNRSDNIQCNSYMKSTILNAILNLECNRRNLEIYEWFLNQYSVDILKNFKQYLSPQRELYPTYWKSLNECIKKSSQISSTISDDKCIIN